MSAAGEKRFVAFVRERYRVMVRKDAALPKPWTADPILRQFKFCNVYREDDAVTRWVERRIRQPFAKHPHLWFMLCAARMINWPDTLEELIHPRVRSVACPWPTAERWDPEAMRTVMLNRAVRGEKVYTGAYMLRGPIQGDPSGFQDKPRYTAYRVLLPLWEQRSKLAPRLKGSLAEAHAAFQGFHGWGDFLVGQVIADLKHTTWLRKAPDWYSWAVLGPGSTRGLNRVHGYALSQQWKQEDALKALTALQQLLKREARELPRVLCLQDVQNALCETDKYERVRLGQGRPRSLYPGT